VLAVDGDWKSCGMAAEILALAVESRSASRAPLRAARVTHPDAPAPTSKALEQAFYFTTDDVVSAARRLLE
jgi:acetoin:2,6-dichlorophenolindophenol oxidoreductase subunit beta